MLTKIQTSKCHFLAAMFVFIFSSQCAFANGEEQENCAKYVSGLVLEQSVLQSLYRQSSHRISFSKVPVLVFEIPADPLHSIPIEILKNLGSLDAVVVEGQDRAALETYLSGRKYIILNYVLKGDSYVPDFYPISEESFLKGNYFEVSQENLAEGNPALFEEVYKDLNAGSVESLNLKAMQKPGIIEMIPTRALGFSDQDILRVKGGLKNPEEIQTKPAGAPAFFSANDRGIYLINADSNGNPAGHFPTKP